jgi:hypothetical protein
MTNGWFEQLEREGWAALDREKLMELITTHEITTYSTFIDTLLLTDLRQLVKKDFEGERKLNTIEFVRHIVV